MRFLPRTTALMFILAAAAPVAVDPTPGAAADPVPAADRRIRGVVRSEGAPLGGVLVSDGLRVVRTDGQGRYELPSGGDGGRFVFVTTPPGHWTDSFHVPRERAARDGQADFALRRRAQPERFDFAFITDMHIDGRGVALAKFRATLDEINGLQPRPAFLWAQGDICLQGRAGDAYVDALRLVAMPVRNGAGNHEMILAQANPRGDYERRFGPTYYSFDWGAIHCIVLDGNKPIPGAEGWRAVHGAVEGCELEWLRADLAAQPTGKAIVVGIHIPIVTTYPERRRESPPDAPYWEVANRHVLTALFTRYRVRLVLQGHMHENERAIVGGVEYVSSISLCGSWFKNGTGFERGVDGTPRGYRIVSVDGTRITHRYQSSCESRVVAPGEFLGLEKPVARGPALALVINCHDAPNGSTAETRIDDGPWRPMQPFAAMNKKIGLAMPHHFRLLADTSGLAPGPHTVDARVHWPGGEQVEWRGQLTIAGE